MDFSARRKKLRSQLKKWNIEALVIDEVTDLYYLTGLTLSLGRLLVTRSKSILFVDGRYFEACKREQGVSTVLTAGYGSKSAFASALSTVLGPVGFDETHTSYESARQLIEVLESKKRVLPLKNPLRTLRQIKDEKERALLQRSASLASKGYGHVLSLLKEGITEIELVNRLKIFWLESGAQREAFSPIIAFGPGSADPHYHPQKRRLKRGDPVLIDIGVVFNHYHSDMTRVVFFGEPLPELKKIYFIVKKAMDAALQLCKPGVFIGQLDAASREFITAEGYEKHFTHGLGHGVGLETHEWPVVKNISPFANERLAVGMTITIEPGIYLPGLGGVRIEDTVIITEDGYKNLTRPTKRCVVYEP